MQMQAMYEALGVQRDVYAYGEAVLAGLQERFAEIDRVAEQNQAKVIWAMQKNRVSAQCFRRCTRTHFTRKRRWCARRSRAGRTRWRWRFRRTYCRGTSCCRR